jgi:hypothetical protein
MHQDGIGRRNGSSAVPLTAIAGLLRERCLAGLQPDIARQGMAPPYRQRRFQRTASRLALVQRERRGAEDPMGSLLQEPELIGRPLSVDLGQHAECSIARGVMSASCTTCRRKCNRNP